MQGQPRLGEIFFYWLMKDRSSCSLTQRGERPVVLHAQALVSFQVNVGANEVYSDVVDHCVEDGIGHATMQDEKELALADTSQFSRQPLNGIRDTGCECMSCFFPGSSRDVYTVGSNQFQCAYPECRKLLYIFAVAYGSRGRKSWERIYHEKAHYAVDGGYECKVEGCHGKAKRFSDLVRHHVNKHCKVSRKHQCPEPGCERHNKGNGFIRKDKMQSHYKAVHEGRALVSKTFKTIQPKLDGI